MKAAYCTLGCKVNQYDTQAMRELMENAGYDTVDFEEEADVYRRGRNCVHGNVPKSASAVDYRRAPGFEALMGQLWLVGRFDRALEIFDAAFRE